MRGITVAVSAIAVLGLTPVASAGAAAAASDPTGIWINNTGRGAIEIKPCGDKLCGKVVWVKSDADAKGCGKQIIGDVVAAGGGHWGNGWIYSPERGRKYNVELTPLANGTLRVTGYAGLRFLSKTMIWKRASSDLQLCGQIEAKANAPAAPGKPNATTAAATDAKTGDSKTATNDSKPATKPDAASEPKIAAALPPKVKTPPAVTTSETPPVSTPKNADEAAKTESAPPPPTASKDSESKAAPPEATQPDDQTASADDGASDLENKLNDLGLGKIFTKTKSGKCKVDLPWVKVTIDCEQ